jgi:hypothetical protein
MSAMPRPFSPLTAALVIAAMLAAPAHRASAQLPIPSVTIVGGVTHFNLAGSGTSAIGALRIDVPLLSLIAEGSLAAFRSYEEDGRRTYLIPEAQLQWQLLPLLVRPYIGLGGGLFRAIEGPGPHPNEFTGSASAGVRVGIPFIAAGFRGEVRVRGIGSRFGSSATEFVLGVKL